MGQKGGHMSSHNFNQSTRLVFARATFYPNKIRVFIPNVPFEVDSESDAVSRCPKSMDTANTTTDEDLERSIRRSKKRISDYVLCNPFELFVTFTFAKNRQDINEKRQQMSNWLKNQRKRNGKFDYLIVPELHHDQQSLHFHALFNGYCGKIQPAINPKNNKVVMQNEQIIYTLSEYTLGFNNAKRIAAIAESRVRIAQYIKKYITKDMPTFYNRQRYWASKDLKLPKIQNNPEPWYLCFVANWETENEFGKILEFNIGENPIIDAYWEKYQ